MHVTPQNIEIKYVDKARKYARKKYMNEWKKITKERMKEGKQISIINQFVTNIWKEYNLH